MRFLTAVLLLYTTAIHAQTGFKFDKRIIDCENKWIVTSTDSSYAYGFVYLDNSAGLTLNVEGSFTLDDDKLVVKKHEPAKIRISPTAVKVAVLPNDWFQELGILESPAWLSFYKTSENDINRLFRLGCTYNQWGDPTTALKYLNAVKKQSSRYPGLDIEYSRAFNEQKDYRRAQTYVNDAINSVIDEQNNCKNYIQQVFLLTGSNKMVNAEEIYFQALCECKGESTKAEMAYNIAFQYFKLNNKAKVHYWRKEVDRWIVPNSYLEKIDVMLGQLK
jgi:tetratricopeptide (TPR) repeat protein